MARMIPELSRDRVAQFKSRAEARFYEACTAQLSDQTVVFHSVGWLYRDKSGRVREGEADFTIVSPSWGILVVEVKGGGIAFDGATGSWFSTDRNGNRHSIKDPFRQASDERHYLLDQLTSHSLWRQWRGKRLTIGHAVFVPDVIDAMPLAAPERPKSIVGTNSDILALRDWVEAVFRFWRQDGDDPIGAQGVRLVEEILRRSLEVKPALRAAVDDAEQTRIRLTANQARILRTISGRRRAVISGGAGTGKTLLAVAKARQFAERGLSVLLLCYNRPLADSLRDALVDVPLVSVHTFHQLCDRRIRRVGETCGRNLLTEAAEAYPGLSQSHHFEVQMPYALALSNEVLEERYDAIVVDEAQDFSDEYWFAIEELLSDQSQGYLYIFIDENQRIYRRHGNLPISDEPFYLTSNCRNTAQIHQLGYCYYSGEAVDPPELSGPKVEVCAEASASEQAEAVVRRFGDWVRVDGLAPERVVVLLAGASKAECYSLLSACARGGPVPLSTEVPKRGHVHVDTVARFKGLESDALVLWLGDDIADEGQWESVYVGVTRAKSLLCIVCSPRLASELRV